MGRVVIVDGPEGGRDPDRRAAAIVAYGRSVEATHVLVELDIDRRLPAEYARPLGDSILGPLRCS